jgi:hypothetical protein
MMQIVCLPSAGTQNEFPYSAATAASATPYRRTGHTSARRHAPNRQAEVTIPLGPWSVASSNSSVVAPGSVVVPADTPEMVHEDSDDHVRAYVSRLWAEDWDSPEDSLYDDL